RITVGLRHARENLRRMVEAVVDQMIEPDVVVPWQTHRAGDAVATPQKPGRQPHQDEGQREEQWRQLEHNCRRYQVRVTPATRGCSPRQGAPRCASQGLSADSSVTTELSRK